MEDIKKGLDMLETVELQILGSLYKIKSGNKEGEKDIETVARKCKATCKLLKFKMGVLEKELKDEKKKNSELSNELNKITGEKRKLETELNNSECLFNTYFDDSYEDSETKKARISEEEQLS